MTMRGNGTGRFDDRDFLAQSSWQTLTPRRRSDDRPRAVSLDQGWAEWLVEGRLPRHGSSLLVGAPDAGKSTLARELALAVARGRPWLDFRTKQGPVLYVFLEGDQRSVRAAFARLGLSPEDNLHFVEAVEMSRLRERIRERAKSVEPALIVIDGLRPLLYAEALNDLGARTSALDRILDLPAETGAHVMLVHDVAGPMAEEMGPLLNSTRNQIDAIFMMSRTRDERLLRSIQTQGRPLLAPIHVPKHPEPKPAPYEPPRVQSAPMTATHPEPPKPKPPIPHPELRREILAYLRLSGRLATQKEISEYVQETNAASIYACLSEMCHERRLIRVGSGEAGDPYRYTGCDLVKPSPRTPWLTRVRPWARVGPIRLVSNDRSL